jgi:hypothetical protein
MARGAGLAQVAVREVAGSLHEHAIRRMFPRRAFWRKALVIASDVFYLILFFMCTLENRTSFPARSYFNWPLGGSESLQ